MDNKKNGLTRRNFIERTGAATLAVGAASVARGAPAHEKVHLAWIGCGGRGTGILGKTVAGCKDARIVAVCDLKKDRISRAQRVAERDKPQGYTDFRKMMDREKLDGIVVATEVGNHAKVVIPVLEAGFHCFSEKPMDCTVEKIDAITNAARKAKGFYQIGTQRRYHPGFLAGMKQIHSGKYGKVTFMQGHWHWNWSVGGWVQDVEMSGGELVEQAVHHMDVMTWAMQNQAPVKCVSIGYQQIHNPRGPKIQSEDHSATAFVFADGVIFSYTHQFLLPPQFIDEKLWVFCEEAGFDLPTGMLYDRTGGRKSIAETSLPEWNQKTRDHIADLAGRIRKGGVASQQELIDAVTKAAGGKDWGKGTSEEFVDFVANIKSGGKRKPNANVETGRVCTLMALMGRAAMYNAAKAKFEPRVIAWKDLGSTTDPSA